MSRHVDRKSQTAFWLVGFLSYPNFKPPWKYHLHKSIYSARTTHLLEYNSPTTTLYKCCIKYKYWEAAAASYRAKSDEVIAVLKMGAILSILDSIDTGREKWERKKWEVNRGPGLETNPGSNCGYMVCVLTTRRSLDTGSVYLQQSRSSTVFQ